MGRGHNTPAGDRAISAAGAGHCGVWLSRGARRDSRATGDRASEALAGGGADAVLPALSLICTGRKPHVARRKPQAASWNLRPEACALKLATYDEGLQSTREPCAACKLSQTDLQSAFEVKIESTDPSQD